MKQSAPYAVIGLGVLVMAGIAWWFGFRNAEEEVPAPAPQAPAIELSEGLSIYTNGEDGFLLTYPEGARVSETFMTHRLPESWSVTSGSQGTPLVEITTYEVRNETTYPRDYTVVLRIGKSTDQSDVASCIETREQEVQIEDRVIGDTTFSAYSFGDAAMMQYVNAISYRTKYKEACWAIEAVRTGSSYRDTPSSADIAEDVLDAEFNRLQMVVDSFRFVR